MGMIVPIALYFWAWEASWLSQQSVLCIPDWPWTCLVTKVDLELLVFLLPLSSYWNYRHAILFPVWSGLVFPSTEITGLHYHFWFWFIGLLRTKLWASWVSSEHPFYWTTSTSINTVFFYPVINHGEMLKLVLVHMLYENGATLVCGLQLAELWSEKWAPDSQEEP